MDTRALMVRMYDAFNQRDVEGALAFMSDTVSWPKASEGGRVVGKDAIREYWSRQWTQFDPLVDVLDVVVTADGRADLRVHQVVRDRQGALLSDTEVRHVYTFADGLIESMSIDAGDDTREGASAAFSATKDAT